MSIFFINIYIYDTCAWTPNKVFIHFLLVSVDNECVGKCRQVYASVGKSARQV